MVENSGTPGRKLRTRQKLFAGADALFYEHGVRATSVDEVAAEAGVTKVTLYSHFASKDELVTAYLDERDRRWRESLEDTLASCADPGARLLAVFDAYREWVKAGDFRGCAFVNCAAEFPDPAHPVRAVIRRHKAGVRGRLKALATEAGVEDPASLSEQLFVVLEGTYVTAALEGDEQLFSRVRALVDGLVQAAAEKSSV
ncbi:MAG: TetR/AcrR family transcriptional regulator [Rubrobacteraceae bacterium]